MTPATAVAMLDRALARNGTVITLRRYAGEGTARTAGDVIIRARVRDYEPAELVGGIAQGDSEAVLSPTQIRAAGWGAPDHLPVRGDRIVIGGRERAIEAVDPERIAGEVVRINVQVRG